MLRPSRQQSPSSTTAKILTAALLATTALGCTEKAGAAVLSCPNIDKIQQVFLNQHISGTDPDAVFEGRLVEQYIKRMDGAKIYLLESDVNDIKKDMKGIFAQLKKGECGILDKVQDLFVKRVAERAEYAKKTLQAKNFKFDQKTELTLDPDSRSFPKTKAEADTFQGKYLQFQISNYVATGMTQKEAQEKVVRNYERVVKKIKDTSKEDLYSGYLDSFGRAKDPHSSYFSRDVLEDFEIQMGLSLEGIGATLSWQDGFTVVEQLIDGGSAKASGLILAQDKIVAVGQFEANGKVGALENVVEEDLRDVVRKIRGPKDTKVRLQILRKKTDGTNERLLVDLKRDKIKLEDDAASVHYIERDINGEKKQVAILDLPSFYADARRGGRSSASDMKAILKDVKKKGVEALVLDLSTNGGGSLDDAVKISGLFFKTGNVVKQSSRDAAQPEITLDDHDATVDWDGPMVVLTSRVSASASEIVAGTLKDYNRAVIVGGDHTFGKGSVQSVVQLPPGLGAVKVTVGMFFTPGGFSTQWRGVEGDITFPGPYATDEFGEKHLDYSLPPKQIAPFISPEAFVTQGAGVWKKVEPTQIAQLKTRSLARIAKNADFAKIEAEMKKAKEKGKVIKLAESLKDTKDKKGEADSKKNLNKEGKVAEYLKRADIQEAATVAADLAALQKGIVLTDATAGKQTAETSPEPAKKTR